MTSHSMHINCFVLPWTLLHNHLTETLPEKLPSKTERMEWAIAHGHAAMYENMLITVCPWTMRFKWDMGLISILFHQTLQIRYIQTKAYGRQVSCRLNLDAGCRKKPALCYSYLCRCHWSGNKSVIRGSAHQFHYKHKKRFWQLPFLRIFRPPEQKWFQQSLKSNSLIKNNDGSVNKEMGCSMASNDHVQWVITVSFSMSKWNFNMNPYTHIHLAP